MDSNQPTEWHQSRTDSRRDVWRSSSHETDDRPRHYNSRAGRRTPPHVKDSGHSPHRPSSASARDRYQAGPGPRSGRHDRQRQNSSPSPPRRNAGRGYFDRDCEGARSPPFSRQSPTRDRDCSRSRSPNRRSRGPFYGARSRDILMEGLPSDISEDDIANELERYYSVQDLEDVRIIRDRRTGQSRHFGFLRFRDARDASEFLESNDGLIRLFDDVEVDLSFSRPKEPNLKPHELARDWTCGQCGTLNFARRDSCLSCHVTKEDATRASNDAEARSRNTGDRDVATDATPSPFLLIRSLEGSVGEEVLAKAITKLYKGHDGTSDKTPKKNNSKVNSTTSTSKLGATPGSLRRVFIIRDRETDESWRYGFAEFRSIEDSQAAIGKYNASDKFTISSKPVLISYIHSGVFVPVLNATTATGRYNFTASSNASLQLCYWDESGYARELVVSVAPAGATAGSDNGSVKPTGEAVTKVKKRKGETLAAEGSRKSAPVHLEFWRNRHAELHGIGQAGEGAGVTPEQRTAGSSEGAAVPSPEEDRPPGQSFADLRRMCCYLCARQFKSAAEVNKHERLSQLHRDNLQKQDLVAKAQRKLAAAAVSSQRPADGELSTEYRDRARERRTAFNQPKNPGAAKGMQQKQQVSATAPAEPNSADVGQESAASTATASKGAALLGKMGWSAGEGLGAQGSGMAAPIQTEAYVAGVGLGAEGGKLGDALEEANRNTKGGYDTFLHRTKEKAKERYERM